MSMKTWNVRVHKPSGTKELGQVHETSEELARCAALSKFGLHADEDTESLFKIGPDDDFDVSEA